MSICTCDPGPEGQHAAHCGYGPEDYAVEQAGAVVGAAIEGMTATMADADSFVRDLADTFQWFAEKAVEAYAVPWRDITPDDWARAGELLVSLGVESCDCPTPLHTMRCGAGGHVRVTDNREGITR